MSTIIMPRNWICPAHLRRAVQAKTINMVGLPLAIMDQVMADPEFKERCTHHTCLQQTKPCECKADVQKASYWLSKFAPLCCHIGPEKMELAYAAATKPQGEPS